MDFSERSFFQPRTRTLTTLRAAAFCVPLGAGPIRPKLTWSLINDRSWAPAELWTRQTPDNWSDTACMAARGSILSLEILVQ